MVNSPLRVSEFVDLLYARSDPWKPMALMRAYFDESGMHGQAPMVGLAGFVAPGEVWVEIESQWQALLGRLSDTIGREVSSFHAVDCENGEGMWTGVSRPIREAFNLQFAKILIQQKALKGYCAFVIKEDWEKIATPEFKAHNRSPYQFCADKCFQQMAAWQRQGLGGRPIALIYAEHQKHSERAREIFEHYMAAKPWAHVKSLTFSSPDDLPALQCADMLAYESFIYWCRLWKEGAAAMMNNERPAMHALLNTGKVMGTYVGGRGLALNVKRWHVTNRLADPYPDL